MKFQQAKHYRRDDRTDVLMVVIHTMEYPERDTSAEWCSGFFTNPRGPKGPVTASCHYAVDNDSVTQCVREQDIAWHTPGAIGGRNINDFSIGIEHAGYASQTAEQWADAYSIAMLERSAELVADICDRYSIPVRRLSVEDLKRGDVRGIVGHGDCTKATGTGSHWDPGPNFPWAWFIERVRSHERSAPLREPSLLSPAYVNEPLDASALVPIDLNGVVWLVSPVYIAPIGIGEAAALAERLGCEVPTPALVDAIWRAADLRVPPEIMIRSSHDGSAATMDAPVVHAEQATMLEQFVGSRSLGRDFRLLAGAFKDVIRQQAGGKLGLYGWHADEGSARTLAKKKIPTYAPATPGLGVVVQPPYFGHASGWRDYSQGLRLVRRA